MADAYDGFLKGYRYFIIDRDPLYPRQFRDILKSSGVKTHRFPARSPNLNAFAERFVLTIKAECSNHIVPLGERHLRRAAVSLSSTTIVRGTAQVSTTGSSCGGQHR